MVISKWKQETTCRLARGPAVSYLSTIQHHGRMWRRLFIQRKLRLFFLWFSYITNCVSWKESYDKPRQHIKKQRHHLAKGPYSQSYGFGASHVHMWELDHEEGWVLKNWCFQIMVLEKTLESPLNWKGIKPVNSKGNQPWVFIGRTDAEAPVLWPPDVKIWLIGKDPDAGRYWGQEGKEATENEMIRMDMSLSKLLVILKDRETCYVVVHRVTKSQTQLSGWTTPPTARWISLRQSENQRHWCNLSEKVTLEMPTTEFSTFYSIFDVNKWWGIPRIIFT